MTELEIIDRQITDAEQDISLLKEQLKNAEIRLRNLTAVRTEIAREQAAESR